jgi:tRNA threonylcarbamoyladenosine biosynthesis protein TsaE
VRLTVHTHDADETIALGERLGSLLRPNDVVALRGDLGAGKTTLTRGLARGLGLDADIHSPTFNLIHEHSSVVPLYHVDLYRLETEDDVEALGIDEYLCGGGVSVIEWAERMSGLLPAGHVDIEILFGQGDCRTIIIDCSQQRILEGLRLESADA